LRRTAGILAKIFTEVQYYEYNEIDRGVRPWLAQDDCIAGAGLQKTP
jgi:hypothetical protein